MLTIGQVLAGRYQITGTLTGGGAEAIYKAVDGRLGKPVTVKEYLFEDEATRAALESEARLLIELKHSSLPFVIDHFSEGRRLYLVTEFIGEESLAERMSRGETPPPVEELLDWADELLGLLEYLHGQSQPILHGQIEPSNIYINDRDVFLVGLRPPPQDGVQQSAQARLAYVRAQALGYTSPEQLRRPELATPASDIYSFGATLYALLTNVVPDDSLDRALSGADSLKPIRLLRRDLNKRVARAVMAALALDSKKRPQTARELSDMLFGTKTANARPRRVYARALAAAGALAALVALAGTIWHYNPPSCNKLPPFVSQRVKLPCLEATATPPAQQRPPESAPARPNSDELAAQAAELQQLGDYDRAQRVAEEAIKANPKNSYAKAVKCDVMWDTALETDDFETLSPSRRKPLADCAKDILALTTEPRSAEDYAALSWANTALGKGNDAVANAERAIKQKPDLVMPYMMRAVNSLGVKSKQDSRYQGALTDLNKVLQLRPNYPQARYLHAHVYASRDLLPEAEAEAEAAARLYPQAKTFTLLGDIARKRGDIFNEQKQRAGADEEYDKAVRHYNTALEKNPDFSPTYKRLAQLHFDLEQWGDAHSVLERGIKVRDAADLHYLNGLVYRAHGNQEGAATEFKRAYDMEPTNSTYVEMMAELEGVEGEEGNDQHKGK